MSRPDQTLASDSMRPRGLIIAIDGPAGSGKTTAARNLAAKLGYLYLDTGATFRAVALLALQDGVELSDEEAIARLAADCDIQFTGPDARTVLLNGTDVSQEIRSEAVSAAASRVAVHAGVRAVLTAMWRAMGQRGGVVLEGRDIGTAVFPDADLKFFLVAHTRERAQRRYRQQQRAGAGSDLSLQNVSRDLIRRDEADRSRAHAPLRQAPDALEIDTTHLDPEETLARLLAAARARMSG